MKKIMNFLFGKKYPIFNKEGEIEHSRKDFLENGKESYKEVQKKTGEIIKDDLKK